MQEKRICRRCLLSEVQGNALYQSIQQYIASLPEEQKASGQLYESRLQYCKECEKLVNGMCALCGCFVEVRAVKINQHCAKSTDIW